MQESIGSIGDGYEPRDIKGVRYNVIRRPLSGGKGTIRQHKAKGKTRAETPDQFYRRLGELIKADPKDYFFRWTIYVSPADIRRFRERSLDPILEQLCDWWEWISACAMSDGNYWGTPRQKVHYQTPYFYSPLLEGASTDLDECLETGSRIGLTQVDNLFPELQ